MKPLLVLVFTASDASLEVFDSISKDMPQIQVSFCHSEEALTQALTAQSFDLLVIDLDLPRELYRKAQRLTELIYPEAAVTELDIQHPLIVEFKMKQLVEKWNDAQDDSGPRFWDGIH